MHYPPKLGDMMSDPMQDQYNAELARQDAQQAQAAKWGIAAVGGVMLLGLAGAGFTTWLIYRVAKKQRWI